jgi:processive 1,2-diacylglycerol beta-glucosyltransferase
MHNKINKVLILSASAGAGHVRAAQAIEKAFTERGAVGEIRHIDALEFTTKLFRRIYSKAYLDMVDAAPEVLGWLYDQLDQPWKNQRRRLLLDKLNMRPFIKLMESYTPDLVVCTHFLPAEIISDLNMRGKIGCRPAIVVTDLDVHAMWLIPNHLHYFVAMEETRRHLATLGVVGSAITVSGIPIDPCFRAPKPQAEARRDLGLDPDRRTIMVSAGGYGVGPVDHLMTVLRDLRFPSQIVIACGRNEELKERMAELPHDAGDRVIFHPIGYTTRMDEYMAASDLIVGKPGGLTTAEALASGLVFVIVSPIPGQEERNSDHLLEEGVAIRCNNLPVLAYKIDALFDDTSRLEQMRENVRRFARPDAAYTIVDKMMELHRCG